MNKFVSAIIHSTSHSPVQLVLALCPIGLVVYKMAAFFAERRRNPMRLPLPPGPRGYPFIGSVLEMPTSQPWVTYANWAKVYGDVFSFEVLGQRIIVLNSLEAAQELFEKRSANYSDRPRMPMMIELMDFGYIFSLIPYGQSWRRHRRAFNEHFHLTAIHKYQPIQSKDTRAFLNKLLQSPENFVAHTREALASSILNITYGIQITGFDDPYVALIEKSLNGFNAAGIPGSFLVDLIPSLKYVPSWFPGAGFHKFAARMRKINHDVLELPFEHVLQQMREGTAGPSLAASMISTLPSSSDGKLLAEETALAKNIPAVSYFAGADTTFSAIQAAFLALALYPDVQKKAQAELDAVIGPGRLPEFSDRPSLPYVNALVKETLRWRLIVPLGKFLPDRRQEKAPYHGSFPAVPHMATDDDVYNGHFIPKGSLIFGNAWAILHEERVFEDPEEFRPERYLKNGQLNPDVRQPEVSAFGFGRRLCPGRFLSDNTLFSVLSSTLHAFNVTPSLDENGKPIQLPTGMTTGLISYPEPFKVDIKPRSPSAAALVRDAILGDH